MDHKTRIALCIMLLMTLYGQQAVVMVAMEKAYYTPRASLDYTIAPRDDSYRWVQETLADDYGIASWYGPGFQGNRTASGDIYDMDGYTMACNHLDFGTVVLLENMKTGKKCIAVVNDRGPFIEGRKFDVSLGVAKQLGMVRAGLAMVRCRTLEV